MEEYGKSPWLVQNIEDFLYYCCPECEIRDHSKDHFLQHVFEKHPDGMKMLSSIIFIKKEIPDIENDVIKCDINLKCEVKFENNEHVAEADPSNLSVNPEIIKLHKSNTRMENLAEAEF